MVTATKPRAQTLGATIDRIWASREEKRKLEAQVKEVSETIADLEEKLLERMQAEDTDKAAGAKASVSITKATVANVDNWDLLFPYIAKNKLWHLVQRRVSDPAYRELLDMGKKVPGVQPFIKTKLNVRSI